MDSFEATYNKALRRVFKILNPLKKTIMHTDCAVHLYLNDHAINLLRKYDYEEEYRFFSSYIDDISEGAVWVDQDFNSSNHFYSPLKKRGLYGRRSAMDLAIEYYDKATNFWNEGNHHRSMFFFGAAVHIIQDVTIPQHASIRLLGDHRQYETYIKKTYKNAPVFKARKAPYLLDNIRDYVRFNSRVALKVYRKFKDIEKDENRYYRIARCNISLSMRTSAGAMIMFYDDIFNKRQ